MFKPISIGNRFSKNQTNRYHYQIISYHDPFYLAFGLFCNIPVRPFLPYRSFTNSHGFHLSNFIVVGELKAQQIEHTFKG